jgi:hypothetical protein
MFIPDPGSDFFPFRIPDPNCLHPGSASKNLSILTPKKWFLNSKNMIWDVHPGSRIRMLTFYPLVMSKTEGQTFRYRFGGETKAFWYRSRISLVGNRLFQFCPESALLGRIERIIFDRTNSGKNSKVSCFVSIRHRNVCGTFVERWLLYYFDITTTHPGSRG